MKKKIAWLIIGAWALVGLVFLGALFIASPREASLLALGFTFLTASFWALNEIL